MVILQLGSPPLVSGARPNPIVPGGIPIQGVQWGKHSAPVGGSGGQAKPGEVHEARLFASGDDVNATSITRLAATSQLIPVAKLSFLSDSPAESTGYQLVLSDVVVSSVQLQGYDVQFTLDFASSERRFMMKL